MSNVDLKGLTWKHRRAIDPLGPLAEAFRQRHPEVTIEWTVRPLSDFEHQPIADIAGRFDLMIIDHPFCGDIAASGALLPLEAVMPDLPRAHGGWALCRPIAGELPLSGACVGGPDRCGDPACRAPAGHF